MFKIKNFFKILKKKLILNEKIKLCKYIHIMHNDKFNKPFVDFLNKNFNQNEHLILCKRVTNDKFSPFPEGENVIEIVDLKGLNFDHKSIKKIILHSLFYKYVVDYFDTHRELLDKTYWVMWGGDLYRSDEVIHNTSLMENFGGYLTFTPKDKDILLNKCNVKNKNFYNIEYPLSIDLSFLDSIIKKKHNSLYILANHSAHKTTLELFDILSKYKNENIKIFTIVSYGHVQYKDEIIKKGKSIFGKKFEYISEMLEPEKYAEFLKQMDVFVSNLKQQSATANIEMCFYSGVKVFLPSGITTSDGYQAMGYDLYDTRQIQNLEFVEFSKPASKKNHKLAEYYVGEDYKRNLWDNFFQGEQ